MSESPTSAGGPKPRLRLHIPSEEAAVVAAEQGLVRNDAGAAVPTQMHPSSQAPQQPRHEPTFPQQAPRFDPALPVNATPIATNAPRSHLGQMESPQQAAGLPSRIAQEFLPSPSSFYPEFYQTDNMLPSPLNFTPITAIGEAERATGSFQWPRQVQGQGQGQGQGPGQPPTSSALHTNASGVVVAPQVSSQMPAWQQQHQASALARSARDGGVKLEQNEEQSGSSKRPSEDPDSDDSGRGKRTRR